MTDLNDHHIKRLDEAHSKIDVLGERVSGLETARAVSDERYGTIQLTLGKIESNLGRIAWLFAGSICAAIATFVIKGGLNLVQ